MVRICVFQNYLTPIFRFIAIVLDEWSAKEEFIQLNAVGTDQPLSRGTFDEMSDLYRHEVGIFRTAQFKFHLFSGENVLEI